MRDLTRDGGLNWLEGVCYEVLGAGKVLRP